MSEAALLAVFGTSFLVGLSGAAAPGPLLVLDIRESTQRGFWAGPHIATGHSLVELVVVILLLVGLGPLLRNPAVASTVGIVGGAFLLWMAWGIGRHPQRGAPSFPSAHTHMHGTSRQPIIGGALATLSNPFWFLWWMTIGAALMARSYALGLVGVSAFYIGHILSDYSWYSLVSLAVATGRRLITPRVYAGVMLGCAAFLAGLGVYFIFSGAMGLR
jgi:threonine/homoserine/homoserine lactone efflux protein